MSDPIKKQLQREKDAACAVYERVMGLSGPLTDPIDIQYVQQRMEICAEVGSELLNQPTIEGASNPLFAKPSVWAYWTPINTAGATLSEMAADLCREACKALEDYCNGIDTGTSAYFMSAAQANFRVLGLVCPIFEAAGIEKESSTPSLMLRSA